MSDDDRYRCKDCNNDTRDHDIVEGSPHCRYCGMGLEPEQIRKSPLLAEVERLRAENTDLRAELLEDEHSEAAQGATKGMLAALNDYQAKVAELEAANADLKKWWDQARADRAAEIELRKQAEAENAELRSERDGWKDAAKAGLDSIEGKVEKLIAQNKALKKQLAWFEDAWSWVKAAMLRVQELEAVKAFRHDEVLLKLVAPIIRKIEEHDRPKPEEGVEVIDERGRGKLLEKVADRFTLDAKTFFVVDAPDDDEEGT